MSQQWITIDIQSQDLSPASLDTLSYVLDDMGAVGVEIAYAHDYLQNYDNLFGEIHDPLPEHILNHPTIVTGYFEREINPQEIAQACKDFGIVEDLTISKRTTHEENWHQHWMKYYQPQHLSRYLTIKPVWKKYQAQPLEQIIELDPGLAFGTGNHLTTQLSAQAMEVVMRGGEDVIDVGTGSGILSFIAKILGAKRVWGYDLDPQAIDAAQANLMLQTHPAFEHQSDQNAITFQLNDLLTGHTDKAHVIVANILPHILVNMFEDATHLLHDQGFLILGGILQDKGPDIQEAMAKYPFTLRQELRSGEWVSFIYQKKEA